MKKVLVVCVAVAALMGVTSCEKGGDNGKLDPNAMISIRPAEGVKADVATNPEWLTAREIIEQGNAFWCFNPALNPNEPTALYIANWNRDLENNRFKLSSESVISDGVLTTNFMDSKDIIVTTLNADNHPKDTIAYIPNKVMSDAAIAIKAAYAKEDYATCYVLFDQAFRFLPTTGKEYREMQAQNEN